VSDGHPYGAPGPEGEISLASLLNILWRRRLIVVGIPLLGLVAGMIYGQVVTPLYEARAIVRPGITQFGTRGGGYREWKLKDLSRWYGQRLYRNEVAAALGVELWEVPKIRAEFVMRGLQTTEGGNVLTLSILDPDPDRAMRVLDSSIDAFGKYVLSDSTSNSLVLSERGLMIQIEGQQREMDLVRNEQKRLERDLSLAVRDSAAIVDQERNALRDLEKLEARKGRIDADLATYELREERLQSQIQEVSAAVEQARAKLLDGSEGEELDTSIKPSAQLTETEAYRGLLESSVALHDRLQQISTGQDSLRLRKAELDLEISQTRVNQTLNYDLKKREAGRAIADLRLQLNPGIQLKMEQLELQVREREAQIAALSPIERVGPITASPRPVRPRKMRAITILTFAGLLGGLALAFVADYVWNHRAEIFSRRHA
jgi:hypothetical protein